MKKNIFKSLSLLLVVASLTSCLKDDRLVLDPEKGTNVIEFANPSSISSPSGSVYPLYSFAYDVVPSTTLPVSVSYSGPEATAPEDIVVNIGLGTVAEVNAYNTDQETDMELITSDLYKISATTVTIKKGESKAGFTITFSPDKFNLSSSYALPLKITSVSKGTISGNFGTIIIGALAKNRWDGVYRVTTGTMKDVTAPGLSHINDYLASVGSTNMEYSLTTISATKCVLYDDYFFGGFYSPIASSTTTAGVTTIGYSNYGSFCAILEFDPATNKVIGVTNYQGQPAANTRAGRIDPTGVNTYNPANKTIDVTYNMLQPSVVPASPNVRTTWHEVMTYIGSRP